MLLAAQLSDHIDIVGFDLWGNGKHVNNVYKDTTNYGKADSHSIDPSYWIYQVSKVFACYSDKYFVIYNIEGWKQPDEWKLPNVEVKTLDKFPANV